MTLGSSATLFPDLPRLLEKSIPWSYSQANTGNIALRLESPAEFPDAPPTISFPIPEP